MNPIARVNTISVGLPTGKGVKYTEDICVAIRTFCGSVYACNEDLSEVIRKPENDLIR